MENAVYISQFLLDEHFFLFCYKILITYFKIKSVINFVTLVKYMPRDFLEADILRSNVDSVKVWATR